MQTEFPGVIYAWDVVNEAVEVNGEYCDSTSDISIRTHYASEEGKTDNLWYKVMGEDYIELAFTYARKYADPDVKLFYNDYNTFQPVKLIPIMNLLTKLKEKGIVDGIGMQSYYDLENPSITGEVGSVADAIYRYAQLELEIQLTELTIRIPEKTAINYQRQADKYAEVFKMLLSLDQENGGPANITNVTFFGLMDEYLFYEGNTDYSRLFDAQLQPKPVVKEILEVVP